MNLRLHPHCHLTAEPLSDTAPIINPDEETLYDTALELIRNKQYELAVTQLRAVIDQYPNGRYTPNAYYWLGDVYIAMPQPQYEKARQALAQVIAFFPGSFKSTGRNLQTRSGLQSYGELCARNRDSQAGDQGASGKVCCWSGGNPSSK